MYSKRTHAHYVQWICNIHNCKSVSSYDTVLSKHTWFICDERLGPLQGNGLGGRRRPPINQSLLSAGLTSAVKIIAKPVIHQSTVLRGNIIIPRFIEGNRIKFWMRLRKHQSTSVILAMHQSTSVWQYHCISPSLCENSNASIHVYMTSIHQTMSIRH